MNLKGIHAVYVLFPWSTPINVISLKARDQRAMTPGFDVSDNRRNQITVERLICGQIWGFIHDEILCLFFFYHIWTLEIPCWRFHHHLLHLSHFSHCEVLHLGQITGKVSKWIFDRTTLDHRSEVIFLQTSPLDWIYYQSFTSDIAWALTSSHKTPSI